MHFTVHTDWGWAGAHTNLVMEPSVEAGRAWPHLEDVNHLGFPRPQQLLRSLGPRRAASLIGYSCTSGDLGTETLHGSAGSYPFQTRPWRELSEQSTGSQGLRVNLLAVSGLFYLSVDIWGQGLGRHGLI